MRSLMQALSNKEETVDKNISAHNFGGCDILLCAQPQKHTSRFEIMFMQQINWRGPRDGLECNNQVSFFKINIKDTGVNKLQAS